MTRQLYATDASLYRVEPRAVAFPKDGSEASEVLQLAAENSIPVTPRGAGSGLAGGAIGDGLIVDFARHNQKISDLDLEKRTIRVGAGVVLDQLNAFLQPHGFCFGPDVATSSRATLGGMIANNSSGARTPIYGTTADHVLGLEVVLLDGTIHRIDGPETTLRAQQELAGKLTRNLQEEIRARMPAGLLKRWPGYGLDRFLNQPSLANILAGSEGTLAGILHAELRITPLPREKGLALIFFDSVGEAMQATVELLDLNPVAIEHIDRVLTDQTVGQLQFKKARDLLELDARPAESALMVEFYEHADDKLSILEQRKLGTRKTIIRDKAQMALVWGLRKAGVALLTGCKGSAKPTTCIEDATIQPRHLPEFVAALQGILRPLGVAACFYGHAASGLLHVRPVLDIHKPEDVRKLRRISDQFSAIVRQFKGSLASEHGVGMARTEYMPEHLGEELLRAMRTIKESFDPLNLLNPGKIIPDTRYRYQIDTRLRREPGTDLALPFEHVLAFAAKDDSFTANLEQCNGCGGCRKLTTTMCPTFRATGEERMSTRGRANIIRSVLEKRDGLEDWDHPDLWQVLQECLSCKACNTECPSNVNLSLLKAELLHARQQREGLSLKERVFSNVELLGNLGSGLAFLSNPIMRSAIVRDFLHQALGLAPERPLPLFAQERFDSWFNSRDAQASGPRGPVYLWDDCFARYYEPSIGRAAVKVLEHAGYRVRLIPERVCCGRPAFSQGNLTEAAKLGRANLRRLKELEGSILFLEPSCYSMFAEDYRELKLEGAAEIARRAFPFEKFLHDLLDRDPGALRFQERQQTVKVHAHCHAKAHSETGYMARLLQRMPGTNATMIPSGCCGMAGSFGAMAAQYDLSKAIAAPLIEMVEAAPPDTMIAASGTSCRQQIHHLSNRTPLHIAEIMADSLNAET